MFWENLKLWFMLFFSLIVSDFFIIFRYLLSNVLVEFFIMFKVVCVIFVFFFVCNRYLVVW